MCSSDISYLLKIIYFCKYIWPLTNPLTGSLANIVDLDEMPHNSAFHQGLHWLLSQTRSYERKFFFRNLYNLCPLII